MNKVDCINYLNSCKDVIKIRKFCLELNINTSALTRMMKHDEMYHISEDKLNELVNSIKNRINLLT